MHEVQLDASEGTSVSAAELLRGLREMRPAADDRERIDRIRLMEELKSVAAAVQAAETAAFCASQAAEQRAQGVPAERAELGIAAQVGLAGGSRRSTLADTWVGRRY